MSADHKVINMTRAKNLTVLAVAILALSACGNDKTGEPAAVIASDPDRNQLIRNSRVPSLHRDHLTG